MLETFFLIVNDWIASGSSIAVLGCFLWGMTSVLFSPCHLASIPLIVAYVGGQERAIDPRQAAIYTLQRLPQALFITIAFIGIICALLGRMLGDVGNYWQILIGGVFGFIAPILAIITIQQKVATGILFILLFAVGHCLPIVVAGSSAAAVRKLMDNSKQIIKSWNIGEGTEFMVFSAYIQAIKL